MKRLFSLIALIMVSVAVTPIAEAKKFGGGKSFGNNSYKTAPAPKVTKRLRHLNSNNKKMTP